MSVKLIGSRWNAKENTRLCGLIGHPVIGNPTQAMFEAAFEAATINWRYLSMEVLPPDLPESIRGLRALGFKGCHITVPHKVAAAALVDELAPSATVIGAVNCIVIDEGRLIGANTDGQGFLEGLRELADPIGARVVVLGAGGAARAVAVELALAGASEILVVNRSAWRGDELADLLRKRTAVTARSAVWSGDYVLPVGTDILVNATSIGLTAPSERVPIDWTSPELPTLVADVVMNPPRTRFLEEAIARGCTSLSGLAMLVNQGALAFRLWTGIDPDKQVMRAAAVRWMAGK